MTTLPQVLAKTFHSIPDECWSPRHEPGETRFDRFWLLQLYSAEHEIEGAQTEWVRSGNWPELSDRTRYFLRVQLEDVSRILSSDDAPEVRSETPHIFDSGPDGRKALVQLIAKLWTRDFAMLWAKEAAKYGTPRRVYVARARD